MDFFKTVKKFIPNRTCTKPKIIPVRKKFESRFISFSKFIGIGAPVYFTGSSQFSETCLSVRFCERSAPVQKLPF